VLTDFFYRLRTVKIPVSVTEYLTLLRALEARVAAFSVDEFYYLARCTLVKDERYFDRFDQVFGDYIQGKTTLFEEILGEIPLDWLKKQKELNLSEEEKQKIESLGGRASVIKYPLIGHALVLGAVARPLRLFAPTLRDSSAFIATLGPVAPRVAANP
jgi:uncharacterized protein with von Willebrand factor type A (vWA) domain